MFLSFYLDGWSVPRRALGKCEVLTLPTASGRSDQSHRLAPRQQHSILMPTKNHGKGGTGKENTTYSRKGALTTARPLWLTHVPLGRLVRSTSPKLAIPASGPRAVTQPNPIKSSIKTKMNEWVTECATHIFPSEN